MITVNVRSSSSEITNRQLPKNSGISIFGKVTGMIGIGEPLTVVRIEVINKSGSTYFVKETSANFWGDYNFYFVTPDENTNMIIKLYATYSTSGQDLIIYPVGIGSAKADPLPAPVKASSILDYIPLILLLFGGLAVYNITKK